jgi:hypothetical protein
MSSVLDGVSPSSFFTKLTTQHHDRGVVKNGEALQMTTKSKQQQHHLPEDVRHSHELATEINVLVQQRSEFRRYHDYAQADAIQQQLREAPYHVEIIDRCGAGTVTSQASSEWVPRKPKNGAMQQRSVVWSSMTVVEHPDDDAAANKVAATPIGHRRCLPLLVCTVDSPKYIERYQDTLSFLDHWQQQQREQQPVPVTPLDQSDATDAASTSSDGNILPNTTWLEVVPCCLLDLEKNPLLEVKSIVYEGWRQILLPWLLNKYPMPPDEGADDDDDYSDSRDSQNFVLIAEDDIRFPNHTNPEQIYHYCSAAFRSNPEIQLLSLGHAWKGSKHKKTLRTHNNKSRSSGTDLDNDHNKKYNDDTTTTTTTISSSSMLQYLQQKGPHVQAGIHALTLVAVRVPHGIRALWHVLEDSASNRKRTHLDQFLFHSHHHELPIAFCDPPLAGWAEVSVTLTNSASGYRRREGGRTGHLPPPPLPLPLPQVAAATTKEEVLNHPNGEGGGLRWIKRTVTTTPGKRLF